MSLEDYKTKDSVVLVFTGDGKGKTSASLGLMVEKGSATFRRVVIRHLAIAR